MLPIKIFFKTQPKTPVKRFKDVILNYKFEVFGFILMFGYI